MVQALDNFENQGKEARVPICLRSPLSRLNSVVGDFCKQRQRKTIKQQLNKHLNDTTWIRIPYRTKIRRTKVSKFQLSVENFVRRNILSVENFVQYLNTKVRKKIGQNCRNFGLVSKILSDEILCPSKILSEKVLCFQVILSRKSINVLIASYFHTFVDLCAAHKTLCSPSIFGHPKCTTLLPLIFGQFIGTDFYGLVTCYKIDKELIL